jgi:hypothetical protein
VYPKSNTLDFDLRREMAKDVFGGRVELEGGRNQQPSRGISSQSGARKITVRAELVPVEMPANAHPIVERLQGKMEI